MNGKASIIIVTFNNLELTKACIRSVLAKTDYPDYEIIIVDNNSTDGTPEYLRALEKGGGFIKVLLNGQNEGFAKANNQGIAASMGDYIVLLNNDTVVTNGWLTKLINYLERNPDIGMIGPVTNSWSNEAKIYAGYKDIHGLDDFAYQNALAHEGMIFDITMLGFYCVCMRKKIIDEVGLLDERFGIGMFEDDDFCYRVRLKGYRIVCAEDVFIHHEGMASFSKLGDAEYRRLFDENRKKFEEKWGIRWKPLDSKLYRVILERNALIEELDHLLHEKKNLEEKLDDIYHSKTWRLIQPLLQVLRRTGVIKTTNLPKNNIQLERQITRGRD